MSLTLHVLLPRGPLPNRDSWQAAVDKLGLPFILDPSLELPVTLGFRPCTIRGQASGFELNVESAADLAEMYPSLGDHGHDGTALTFYWGGDVTECACVMAAAAGLVSAYGGTAYYPDDDLMYDLEALQRDFRECLAS